MEVLTTWLKPIKSIGGRDPLGVRMPSEIIYADLVPGITNVTDRARYYSFYPYRYSVFCARRLPNSSSEE
jgi:hypothetical protein